MICRICAWVCQRLGCDNEHELFREEVHRWESASSNDWELWLDEADEARDLNARASELSGTDPVESLRLRVEAANTGSAWAMQKVGWHHETGTIVPADFEKAREYYHRAIGAGSWMATIRYSRLLAKHGHDDSWVSMLEQGVEVDFIPAFYWLARLRYQKSPTGKSAREVALMLQHAADAGHPGAELMLCQLALRGKLGLRQMPQGIRRMVHFINRRMQTNTADQTGGMARRT